MSFLKLDAFLDEMQLRGYPSCALAVSLEGKTVYTKSVGFADHEKTRRLSSDSIAWIFSCTKVITCLAAVRLLDEGKISLSDPVSKYIPEFASVLVREGNSLCKPKTEMTVEHLFTMTAGLDYNVSSAPVLEARKKEGATTLDIVSAMAKAPLNFHPGEHYLYSLCHDVLGAVIEVASGMKLYDYLKKYMFDPLGVKDMGFRPNEEQKTRFCDQYGYNNATNEPIKRELGNGYQLSADYDSGGAGLFATVDDYMKIISVVSNGGVTEDGYRLLSQNAIKMMMKNHLHETALADLIKTKHFGYGWGLCGRVHMNPTVSLSRSPAGEFGWDGAANSFAIIDPVNRISIFFLANIFGNTYGYHVVHPAIRNLVYECLEK